MSKRWISLLLTGCALWGPSSAVARPLSKPTWLRHVLVTEYFATAEAWFVGLPMPAPGISGRHRADWLYGAQGLMMEGSGLDLQGRYISIAEFGQGGKWLTRQGKRTSAASGFSQGAPYWFGWGWRNRRRGVTFPLLNGGWANGAAVRYLPPRGVRFAYGNPLKLRPWRSLAVDPALIPMGSRVFVPAYRESPGGGWFRAQDTGGAIRGRHIDVYRSPPSSGPSGGETKRNQRILVIPPAR